MDSEQKWESFGKRFNKSFSAVFRVAEYVHAMWNESVMVKAKSLAPSLQESINYLDDGDIHLKNNRTVEVKHLQKVHFTCVGDFPFKDIIIANVKSVDRNERAVAYFIVNVAMTHAAIIKTATKDLWSKKVVTDRERNSPEEKYLCDKTLAEFVDLRI